MAEMLRTYPSDGLNTEINALDGYAFQFTNSLNQLVSNDSRFSNIDLGECEALLKTTYSIDPNLSLIFFKYERVGSIGSERDIQYEVYHPITYEKLNLSICEDIKVTLTIPIEISDELAEMIQNIIDQGYNPFDLNDKFYREICTPYNSENGTDVLLDDREEYIYSTIANETQCPSGCSMSSYSLDSKYITCECNANDTGIVALDLNHISGQNILNSVLSTLKNSNYKVMRCYNLVFNFKIFCHNYGSIITLIFFVIYVIFMIYYCCKDITPIKVSISKLLFEEQQKENKEINDIMTKPYIFNTKIDKSKKTSKSTKSKKKKQAKSTKDFAPPKKGRVRRTNNARNDNNNSFERKKQAGDLKLIDIVKNKRHSIKNRPQKDEESVRSDKVRKRKSILDYQAELVLKTREQLLNMNSNDKKTVTFDLLESQKNLNQEGEKDEKQRKSSDQYDDYELNNMEYYDASDFDNRTCLRTYWSVIKREHYVIFTFFSRNDYNLFYVKIERFFILICTEITMNGMFFVHETMYKKQTGGLSFAQKIPQIIFSLLVSHAMEVILCYLSMTDIHYYQIKALPKEQKNLHKDQKYLSKDAKNLPNKGKNDDKIFDILSCMKRKLTAFFILTFLVFLFHWYFISAFCAVYQNTQIIYLRDSGISILTSLIDPFIIYAFTCILRAISLSKCCKKKLSCVYKLSDLIPIF